MQNERRLTSAFRAPSFKVVRPFGLFSLDMYTNVRNWLTSLSRALVSPASIKIWGNIRKTNEIGELNGNNKDKTIIMSHVAYELALFNW